MEFSSFSEFLAMGRHGVYVWSAYGITALIIIYNILQPIVQRKKILKEQRQRLRRDQSKKNPREIRNAPPT